MRLNKYIAQFSGVSRRKADTLIESGVVLVNNQPSRLGMQVAETDEVSVNGKLVKPHTYTYLLLNKPEGFVCSKASQGGDKTIYELLPENYQALKTVGRLDKNSSGLILLSDDGDFAHQLTHPKFHKPKTYDCVVDKTLETQDIARLERGVSLTDGSSRLHFLKQAGKSCTVEISEGRNRQIRRSFAALGYTVMKLHRQTFAGLALGDLKLREYKVLLPADLAKL